MKHAVFRGLTVVVAATAFFGITGCDVVNDLLGRKKQQSQSMSISPKPATPVQAKNNPSDPAVITIDGEICLHKSEFFEFVDALIKSQPYLAQFGITSFEAAPPQVQEQFIDAAVQQQLIAKWGEQENVAQTTAYQEALKKMVESLKQQLVVQSFMKQLDDAVRVTEDEIQKEYEESKASLVKTPGSLEIVGAKLADKERADVLANLVKQGDASFADLATDAGVKIERLGSFVQDHRAAMQSSIPAALHAPLFELGSDGTVARADDGDDFWVLVVEKRSEPEYHAYEEVKSQVEMRVHSKRFLELREQRLGDLRGQYSVTVDKKALGFTGQSQDIAALLQSLQQQTAASEPEEKEERPATVSA